MLSRSGFPNNLSVSVDLVLNVYFQFPGMFINTPVWKNLEWKDKGSRKVVWKFDVDISYPLEVTRNRLQLSWNLFLQTGNWHLTFGNLLHRLLKFFQLWNLYHYVQENLIILHMWVAFGRIVPDRSYMGNSLTEILVILGHSLGVV